MRLFKNRGEAAKELAANLLFLKEEKPIVVGLHRGGIQIADVIARELDAPMDVMLIEKLHAPHAAKQVVGAVDEHGRISMIQLTARWHHLTSQQLIEPARQAFRQMQVLHGRIRQVLPEVEVKGRTVILVGQGVATGAKMLGAIASVRDRGAAKVIAAAPAGTSQATWQLHEAADLVVIPHRPAKFQSVEAFYEDFTELTDDMIMLILDRYMREHPQQQSEMKSLVMKLAGTKGQAIACEVDLPPGAARGSGPYPAVVFAHGFESDSRSARNVAISRRLAKRGIVGMRMDFTGHGRSEGCIDDANGEQMLHDLHTVFQATSGLAEVDPRRVGLVGSGTGGMVALHYAARIHAVRALVIRGPVCGREIEAAHRVTAATLLIHAESDTALLDAIQTLDRELAAQHRLLTIPNSNRMFSDPISMELMVNATVDWLADHLKTPPSEDRPIVDTTRRSQNQPATTAP